MSLTLATWKRFLGGSTEEVEGKGGVDGDLIVSPFLPAGAVITAKGGGYQAMTTTAGPALVVRPSTVPLATLYNGENGGGKTYIMERAFVHQLVSTNTASGFSIWLCVHPVGTDEDIADTITTKNSTRGIAGYSGNANLALATAVADDGWYPWGPSVTAAQGASGNPGVIGVAEINGRIEIPPRGSISIAVVATSIVQTFVAGFHWYENQIDLG